MKINNSKKKRTSELQRFVKQKRKRRYKRHLVDVTGEVKDATTKHLGMASTPGRSMELSQRQTKAVNDILRYFPAAEHFRIYPLLQFIKVKISHQLDWDPATFELIVNGIKSIGSNIIDILRFLYKIGFRYGTEGMQTYPMYDGTEREVGIPRSTGEFVNVLRRDYPHATQSFLFDQERLEILKIYLDPKLFRRHKRQEREQPAAAEEEESSSYWRDSHAATRYSPTKAPLSSMMGSTAAFPTVFGQQSSPSPPPVPASYTATTSDGDDDAFHSPSSTTGRSRTVLDQLEDGVSLPPPIQTKIIRPPYGYHTPAPYQPVNRERSSILPGLGASLLSPVESFRKWMKFSPETQKKEEAKEDEDLDDVEERLREEDERRRQEEENRIAAVNKKAELVAAEAARVAAEEKRIAEEQEAARVAKAAEVARRVAAEKKRKDDELAKLIAAEKKRKEEEQKRLAEEKKKKEEEQKRIAEEKKKKDEEIAKRAKEKADAAAKAKAKAKEAADAAKAAAKAALKAQEEAKEAELESHPLPKKKKRPPGPIRRTDRQRSQTDFYQAGDP